MKRLTEKQREAYVAITNDPEGSLRGWAKQIGIAHTSLLNRLFYMARKGYIEKVGSRWHLTSEGLEQYMNDEIHNRFIVTNK